MPLTSKVNQHNAQCYTNNVNTRFSCRGIETLNQQFLHVINKQLFQVSWSVGLRL